MTPEIDHDHDKLAYCWGCKTVYPLGTTHKCAGEGWTKANEVRTVSLADIRAAETHGTSFVNDSVRRTDAPEAETFQGVFRAIFDEAFDLLVERQRKYGPENIARQGLYGVFTRLAYDKIERLRRSMNGVLWNGEVELDFVEDFGDESFEDTLLDIANYALIMLALRRGVWGRPLA
jgi:hypothetical protein